MPRPLLRPDDRPDRYRHRQTRVLRLDYGDLGLDQARDRAPATRCRHTANLAPIDALPDEHSTAEQCAADRPDADTRSERTILDTASRSSIDMINRLDYIDPRKRRPTDPAEG